jgi:hypothetical protein
VGLLQVLGLEKPVVKMRQVPDRLQPAGTLRLVEPGMRRREDAVMWRQCLVVRRPTGVAFGPMEHEEEPSPSSLEELQAYASHLDELFSSALHGSHANDLLSSPRHNILGLTHFW